MKGLLSTAMALLLIALTPRLASPQSEAFRIEEASISDMHRAIQSGQVTCTGIVQAYIERAKAYNGSCTVLVTKDGGPIPAAVGPIRAGVPLSFPSQTIPVSKVLPNFDEYAGPPMEFGRMEPMVSDPTVQQQFGMRVGVPNAGQLNALSTLNIRGERSVTCKGDFDRAPSAGALPPGAPKACEEFRKLPDALERAAELDKQYGSEARSREPADVLRGVLVEELVRRQGHARDRRQRRELRDGCAGARLDRRRATCARRAPSALRSPTRAAQAARPRAAVAGAVRARIRHQCCSKPTPRTAYGVDSRAIRTTRSACLEAPAPARACPLPRISSPARCASRRPHRAKGPHPATTS